MAVGYFSGDSRYYVDIDAAVTSQDYGANTSTYYWRVLLVKIAGSGYWSASEGGNNYSSTWAGSGAFAYDFRGSTPKTITLAEGYATLGHDGNGYASLNFSVGVNLNNGIGYASASGILNPARIPKPPAAPGAPTFTNVNPTTATASWTATPNNNGASVDQYLLRVGKSNPVTSGAYTDYPVDASTLSKALTGLTPGTNYYAVTYAHNAQGYSPASAQSTFKTPSGAYAWNGAEWRPCEVLRWDGASWVSVEVNIRTASGWVLAS